MFGRTGRRFGALAGAVLVVGSACGSTGGARPPTTQAAGSTVTTGTPATVASTLTTVATTTSATTGGTVAAATTTTAKAFDANAGVPLSPIYAVLDQTYHTKGGAFDAVAFRIGAGAVQAYWYQVGDTWAVFYKGVDQGALAGKCVGNSIKTAAGFANVTNAPVGSATACAGFTTKILPAGAIVKCGGGIGLFVYVTAIPIAAAGTLYASIEMGLPDGSIMGITSQAPSTNRTPPPILDLSKCTPLA